MSSQDSDHHSTRKGSTGNEQQHPHHGHSQEQRLQQVQPVPTTQNLNLKPIEEEPSLFVQSVRAIFGFRKTSLTLFVVLTYVAVFLLVPLARHYALSLPSKEPAYLDAAWLDLQSISHKPHPYVSHSNDDVHDYILGRVQKLAKLSTLNITVDDDMATNLTMFEIYSLWKDRDNFAPLHYFESSNVLVKVEGSDPSLEGVLLSAHYDSVPTGYGTTDDGTGVASMLGVLEHYVHSGKQPLRTLIFNFNNNEEFGLFGAEAFFNHPWSKDVAYFVNLEGTGTGERAVLFRTTDYDIAKHYKTVSNPFATSIFQQGFATGIIGSETDYRIYHEKGLRGFDIAFYKPRDLYHTKADDIRHSSKNALWHMLSQTLELTQSLTTTKEIGGNTETQAVFFDVLGLKFIALPLTTLTTINIILLVIVPVILLFFGVIISKRGIWSTGFSWLRLPVSVVLGGLAAKFVNEVIYYFNPFIVVSDYTTALVTVGSTFLLVNYSLLTISQALWPVHDFKLIITIEVYAVLWILLLLAVIKGKSSQDYTGLYMATITYTLYSISVILGLFGISVAAPRKKSSHSVPQSYGSTIEPSESTTHTVNESIDERAPLLSNSIPNLESDGDESLPEADEIKGHPEHNSFTYDWSLQFLILVPINFLLTFVSLQMILSGINQISLQALASHQVVFQCILVGSITLTIPLLSFAYKLNYFFAILLILSVSIGGLSSIFSEPFTKDAPISFRVAEVIDLDSTTGPFMEVHAREGFIKNIISDLPSVKRFGYNISCSSDGDGTELCTYPAERPWLFNGTSKENELSSYLTVDVLKASTDDQGSSPYAPLTAEISINVKENRVCQLNFNSSSYQSSDDKSPLRMLTYYHSEPETNKSSMHTPIKVSVPSGGSKDSEGNDVFKWAHGIDQVNLHKLDWSQNTYHLGLQWVPKWLEDGEEQEPIDSPENKLGVHITCLWGEYDDVAIVGEEVHRKIPAFDEILQYSPDFTSWSNRYEGLVKVEKYIEL